jgi:transcriptional regulator with XRE-family HTH domain
MDQGDLGDFLKTRRARIRPEDVGLQSFGRRRVPGLRREELAQLAGVSFDYYVRLEQGRAGHPSEAVLDAIARALRLDEAERAHLFDLTKPVRRRRAPRAERVRPEVRRLVDTLHDLPAMVIGRRMDVLAWNRLAAALLGDWGALPREQRNTARHFFLDEGARRLYRDWDENARATVGWLRLAAGRHPDDAGLAELVGELSMKSEEFRRLWPRHDVREKTHGKKRFQHPIVGPLTLAYESLALPGDGDQTLVLYTAEPGSKSETALRLLGSAAQPQPAPARTWGLSGLVVPLDHPNVEHEHHDAEHGHDAEPRQDLAPVEVIQDQRPQRLHQVGDRVRRGGDLHWLRQQVTRYEVGREEQQREEDQPARNS